MIANLGIFHSLLRCDIVEHKPRALILDFDGVIVDSEGMQMQAVNLILAAYDIVLSEQDWIERCVGHKTRDFLLQLLDGRVDAQQLDQLVAAKSEAYRVLVQQTAPEARPGIVALVEYAHLRGYRCGIASATPAADILDVVHRLGIADRFEQIVSSDVVARPKPAPDVYVHAAGLLGVEPGRCIVVEDTPTGLAAGRAAGMHCVAFPNRWTVAMDLSMADVGVSALDDGTIREILGKV